MPDGNEPQKTERIFGTLRHEKGTRILNPKWRLIHRKDIFVRSGKAAMIAEDESGVRIRVEVPLCGKKPVEITVPLTEGKPGIEPSNPNAADL